MIAKDFISKEVPPLKTIDSGEKALKWMDEFKTSELPVLDKNNYLGLVTEADILDLNAPKDAIGSADLNLNRPFVFAGQHIYDVFNVISEQNLSLVPVLDQKEHYIGVITQNSLIKIFAESASIKDSGSIVTLELNSNDYVLSQIAHIVEDEDAKILSVYVRSAENSTKMDVTIKINKSDISGILHSFERFDYTVKASFQHAEYYEDMKNRYDEFMRFLHT